MSGGSLGGGIVRGAAHEENAGEAANNLTADTIVCRRLHCGLSGFRMGTGWAYVITKSHVGEGKSPVMMKPRPLWGEP